MKKVFLVILALAFAMASYGADTYETFVSKKGKVNSGGVFGSALSSLVLKLGT